MSERLPYEQHLQEHWQGLDLPDADFAWADMKRRLEDEDDDRVVAWWRRGCMLWSALLLLLAFTGWWAYTRLHDSGEKKLSNKNTQASTPGIVNEPSTKSENNRDYTIGENAPTNKVGKGDSLTQDSDDDRLISGANPSNDEPADVQIHVKSPSRKKMTTKRAVDNKRSISETMPPAQVNGSVPNVIAIETARPSLTGQQPVVKNDLASPANANEYVAVDTNIVSSNKTDTLKKDTVQAAARPDSVDKIQVTSPAKKDSVSKKKTFFSAGLALQQQIPFDSQRATPYNASGRKGTLRDYIPSVYLRYNKEDRWFIQLEFKYGAPQYTKQFQYTNKAEFDTASNSIKTTSNVLQKTYYHQLPITFSYYLLKNWSLGTGLVWNRFSSAVSQQTISNRQSGTTIDTVVSSGVVKANDDSLFAKSYFQAVFETQYQWKRWSLGARYAFGLEPYITFTLPGGVQQQEKNSSLQVFLRYEFWRSKKR